MRRLVIGDIHGGLKALIDVMEKAHVTSDDKLIFLGDYVDGWGDCFALIDFLIDLDKTHDCVFLRGNHDKWLEDFLIKGTPSGGWLQNGGKRTLATYQNRNLEDIEDHVKFFKYLHNYYISDDNIGFVHGGYVGRDGLKSDINGEQDYYWDRSLIEKAINHERRYDRSSTNYELFYPNDLKAHKEIYLGHTNTLFWGTTKPILACNVINMDTGAGYKGGYLSMLDVDTKQYWQSSQLVDLYPDDPHTLYGRQ
jgi:serine/threonine protein phosphatase 1